MKKQFQCSFLVNCQLTDWTEWSWSNPKQRCGNGKITRSIKNLADHGGLSCDVLLEYNEIKKRDIKPCPGITHQRGIKRFRS